MPEDETGEITVDPVRAGPVRVLLVSTDSTFIERLREGLRGSSDVSLTIGHPPDVRIRLDHLADPSGATVVVADAALVRRGSIDTALRSDAAEPELILVVQHGERLVLDDVLGSQARGCIEAGIAVPMFVHAVRTVADGELWLPRWMLEIVYERALAEGVAHAAEASTDRHGTHALTAREVEVLQLVKRGFTNKEVAHRLGISPSTVKKHLHHAFGKRGLFRRRQVYE